MKTKEEVKAEKDSIEELQHIISGVKNGTIKLIKPEFKYTATVTNSDGETKTFKSNDSQELHDMIENSK